MRDEAGDDPARAAAPPPMSRRPLVLAAGALAGAGLMAIGWALSTTSGDPRRTALSPPAVASGVPEAAPAVTRPGPAPRPGGAQDARALPPVLVEAAKVEWAAGHQAAARDLAGRALEMELDGRVTEPLQAAFGADEEYRVRYESLVRRVEALFTYFEDKYDYQHLDRDNATTVWILGQVGMTHKDRAAVPFLEDYLAHSAIEDVRARAADALWLIGDRAAVPALRAALSDPSLRVKGFAASGLGDLGDASAVDPLLALFATLPDNKDETKARIADALGKLGDRRAAPAIKASLETISDPAYVRWARPALDRLTR